MVTRLPTPFTVIIPAFNEHQGIGRVIEEVSTELRGCEIIVVDDGSTDGTAEVAKNYNVMVLQHPRNMGKKAAIFTGISRATNDIVVTIDADRTYAPRDILKLVALVESGYDLAIGDRLGTKRKEIPRVNLVGNRLLSYIISLATGQRISDSQSGLRAYRRNIMEAFVFKSRSLEFETEMTAKATIAGLKVIEVPIDYRARAGDSKLRALSDGYRMAKIIWLAMAEITPPPVMLFFFYPGIASLLAFVGLGASTVFYYVEGTLVQHFFSPLLTLLFALTTLFFLGIGAVLNVLSLTTKRIEAELRNARQ